MSPTFNITWVCRVRLSLCRPHDLLMFVPHDKGNNRFPVGNSICIGTFPDKKSALDKKKQIKAEYSGGTLTSANERNALARGDWDLGQEIIVKPSSLMKEDFKHITTGKITSRKNCDCPFRS